MRILAVGTHPDDIEFGMGATLAKHIQLGDEVYVVILTDGERDDYGYYCYCAIRRIESKKALRILGGCVEDVRFLNLPKVEVDQHTIILLEKEINYFKPDRIYTHSKKDRHQDHRNCHDIVLSAARYVKEILLFSVYSTLPESDSKYIINISKKLLELKIEAIKCFKNQFTDIDSIIKIVEGFAITSGLVNYARKTEEIPYSEGFEILKMVKKNV